MNIYLQLKQFSNGAYDGWCNIKYSLYSLQVLEDIKKQ